MSFAKTPFGDGSNAGSGNVVRTVHNHYGPRLAKGSSVVGSYNVDGVVRELSMEIDGAMLTASDFQLIVPSLPKGAVIQTATVKVTEAFVLGGTTPSIKIGTEGSESTNGVSISEAQAEALGTYVLSTNGTWSSPLAATTTVGVALAGTSPTTTTAGKAQLVIRYILVSAR